jgi:amino-acid N-acetyltransferase
MTDDSHEFVNWFRGAAPYIHAHRGQTFVISFGGEAVVDPKFPSLIHDIALMHSLGIRQVLVHGARPQIEQRLQEDGADMHYINGLRITDDRALPHVQEAAGIVRIQIEALLSMGLANSPMASARLRVTSGNFVTARPLGVRDGIDFRHTGEVRRIDAEAISARLAQGEIVLVSPLGYSPTGEVFNLDAQDVAMAIAISLKARKLIFLTEDNLIKDGDGKLLRQLTQNEAQQYFDAEPGRQHELPELECALEACRHGVERTHLIDGRTDGALLLELFTRDGIGVMISAGAYDNLRKATIDDVGGILELIRPLEEQGILVRRSREKLEMEIGYFVVLVRDGAIIGCAGLYPYPNERMGELACFAIQSNYRRFGRGDMLLKQVEHNAKQAGLTSLFVLTTQTAHWFLERGFSQVSLNELPLIKQDLYNFQRNSKVFLKAL